MGLPDAGAAVSLDLTGFGSVADLLKSAVTRIWPDKAEQAKLAAEIDKAHEDGRLAELRMAWDNAQGQLAVNAEEAKSEHWFVAAWRPAVGWTCACAFFYSFVLQPLLVFLITAFHGSLDVHQLPSLDTESVMPVLLGMLGLGAMRTVERVKGAIPPIAAGKH